jgi:hypothetical protein
MTRTAVLTSVLMASLLPTSNVVAAAAFALHTGQAASSSVTPAAAAPFIGDWTLTLQGPDRSGAFEVSVKVENEKVAAEISSEQLPKRPITEISMADKTLVLGYSFPWEGNPVEAVVSLMPAADGKMTAQIDFARGAYIMSGTATKKEKAKQD